MVGGSRAAAADARHRTPQLPHRPTTGNNRAAAKVGHDYRTVRAAWATRSDHGAGSTIARV